MLSSGQAVVLHKLAIMSKDGDWVIQQDADATGHILAVLSRTARPTAGAASGRRSTR